MPASAAVAHARKTALAMVLLAAGVLLCVLYRGLSGSEHHAFSAGKQPPQTVRLTAGNSYVLSVSGGIKALLDRGADVAGPQCEWSVNGTAPQALTVSPQGTDSKGTNAVATFISPFTGNLHIDCAGWGAVYVDDSDNSPPDVAGWFLLAGVVALTVGVGLGLSAAREASLRRSALRAASRDDQVETFVDVDHGGFGDGEVGGYHGGHVRS